MVKHLVLTVRGYLLGLLRLGRGRGEFEICCMVDRFVVGLEKGTENGKLSRDVEYKACEVKWDTIS